MNVCLLVRVEVDDGGKLGGSFSIAQTLGLVDAFSRWRLGKFLGRGEDVWLYISLGWDFVLEATQAECQQIHRSRFWVWWYTKRIRSTVVFLPGWV